MTALYTFFAEIEQMNNFELEIERLGCGFVYLAMLGRLAAPTATEYADLICRGLIPALSLVYTRCSGCLKGPCAIEARGPFPWPGPALSSCL